MVITALNLNEVHDYQIFASEPPTTLKQKYIPLFIWHSEDLHKFLRFFLLVLLRQVDNLRDIVKVEVAAPVKHDAGSVAINFPHPAKNGKR